MKNYVMIFGGYLLLSVHALLADSIRIEELFRNVDKYADLKIDLIPTKYKTKSVCFGDDDGKPFVSTVWRAMYRTQFPWMTLMSTRAEWNGSTRRIRIRSHPERITGGRFDVHKMPDEWGSGFVPSFRKTQASSVSGFGAYFGLIPTIVEMDCSRFSYLADSPWDFGIFSSVEDKNRLDSINFNVMAHNFSICNRSNDGKWQVANDEILRRIMSFEKSGSLSIQWSKMHIPVDCSWCCLIGRDLDSIKCLNIMPTNCELKLECHVPNLKDLSHTLVARGYFTGFGAVYTLSQKTGSEKIIKVQIKSDIYLARALDNRHYADFNPTRSLGIFETRQWAMQEMPNGLYFIAARSNSAFDQPLNFKNLFNTNGFDYVAWSLPCPSEYPSSFRADLDEMFVADAVPGIYSATMMEMFRIPVAVHKNVTQSDQNGVAKSE